MAKTATTQSPYVATFGEGRKRGRQPLPPEEKQRREAERRTKQNLANKARNRAIAVLIHNHKEEFEQLHNAEKGAIGID